MSGEISFYDIHSHILPGMDDGAKDVNTSLAMLAEAKRQGCRGIVATSHYYRKESIESFLKRRAEAYEKLTDAVSKADPYWVGRIGLGAEVAYHRTLIQDPDLTKLRFGESDYLLLEPPFVAWSTSFLRDIRRMTTSMGLRVIIAHLERYRNYTDKLSLDELFQMDVIIQMDAEELLRWSRARRALSMIKNNMIDVLGSDMHNTSSRPPNMAPALERLARARMENEVQRMRNMSQEIFAAAIKGETGE